PTHRDQKSWSCSGLFCSMLSTSCSCGCAERRLLIAMCWDVNSVDQFTSQHIAISNLRSAHPHEQVVLQHAQYFLLVRVRGTQIADRDVLGRELVDAVLQRAVVFGHLVHRCVVLKQRGGMCYVRRGHVPESCL